MSSILEQWEAEAKIFIDRSTADGTIYMAEPDRRILALIELVRKRDEAFVQILKEIDRSGNEHIYNWGGPLRDIRKIINQASLALTDELK